MKAKFPWGLLFAFADAREVGGRREWRKLIRDLDRSGGCAASSSMFLDVQPVSETLQDWVWQALAAHFERSSEAALGGNYDACFNFEPERVYPMVFNRIVEIEQGLGRAYSLMVNRDLCYFLIENAWRVSSAVAAAKARARAEGRKCRSRFNRKACLEISGLLDCEDMDAKSVEPMVASIAANGGSVDAAYRRLGLLPRVSVGIFATDAVFEAVEAAPEAPLAPLAHVAYRRIRECEGFGPKAVEPKRLYRLIRNRLAVIAAVQRAAPKSEWASAAVAGLVEAYNSRKEQF